MVLQNCYCYCYCWTFSRSCWLYDRGTYLSHSLLNFFYFGFLDRLILENFYRCIVTVIYLFFENSRELSLFLFILVCQAHFFLTVNVHHKLPKLSYLNITGNYRTTKKTNIGKASGLYQVIVSLAFKMFKNYVYSVP